MRRTIALLFGLILVLATTSPVLAVKPERFFLPADDLQFAAGEVCDFPVMQEVVVNREYGLLFPVAQDGSQLMLVTGSLVLREINEATGKSIVVNASGPGKLTFNADGSLVASGGGRWTVFLFPTDVGGPSFHLTTGRVTVRIEADGTVSLAIFPNRTTDLCAALAA